MSSPVTYDRALIAEMLEAYAAHASCDTDLVHLESSIIDQAKALRFADHDDASGVHTARCPMGTDLAA